MPSCIGSLFGDRENDTSGIGSESDLKLSTAQLVTFLRLLQCLSVPYFSEGSKLAASTVLTCPN